MLMVVVVVMAAVRRAVRSMHVASCMRAAAPMVMLMIMLVLMLVLMVMVMCRCSCMAVVMVVATIWPAIRPVLMLVVVVVSSGGLLRGFSYRAVHLHRAYDRAVSVAGLHRAHR